MRTTKLMALLLAALMVVAAFAGCASGVKQDAFDGLEDRVEALEGKIDGVDSSIKELGDAVSANDNKETLDQITNTLNQISDKLTNVENRVTEVEKKPEQTVPTADAAAKAAAQAALVKIEVKKAEFQKKAADYSDEDYAKILEALSTAESAVNAALKAAEVDAAMAKLDADLDQYMTYAMKAYDYYDELFGDLTADDEATIAEVKELLKTVKKVYGTDEVDFTGKLDGDSAKKTAKAYQAELAYLVSEGTTDAKDVYLDVYNALEQLVNIFESGKKVTEAGTVWYENEDGKFVSATFKSLAAYKQDAEDLVDDIEKNVGEELVYSVKEDSPYKTLDALIERHETFAADAELLGGEGLLKLVTNADKLAAAEDQFKNLDEAANAYDKATKYGRLSSDKGDVFYYYKNLVNHGAAALLEYTHTDCSIADCEAYDDGEVVWVSDVYAEVDEILADWVEAYNLSEKNMLAIIEAKENNAKYYTDTTATGKKGDSKTYVARKHYNGLLEKALDKFEDSILPSIKALNAEDEESVQLILDYNSVEKAVNGLKTTQSASSSKKYPANIEMSKISDDNMKIIFREANLFEADYIDEDCIEYRIAEAFVEDPDDSTKTLISVIDLLTFESDYSDLTTPDDGVYYNVVVDKDGKATITDNRADGEIYDFIVNEYINEIKPAADTINAAIATLVEKVEAKTIHSEKDFIDLSGDYLVNADGNYQLVEDVHTSSNAYDKYMDGLLAEDDYGPESTIAAFAYTYEDFVELLDTEEFEAAQKTLAERISTLDEQLDVVLDLIGDIADVTIDTSKNIYYTDLNGNGKYDVGEEMADTDAAMIANVSLADADAVDKALTAYNDWVYAGGSLKINTFELVSDDSNEYCFKSIDEDNDSSEAIKDLGAFAQTIEKRKDERDQLAAMVANALAAHSAYPFIASSTASNLVKLEDPKDAILGDFDLFAYTSYKAASGITGIGVYTVVDSEKPWLTVTYDTQKDRYYGTSLKDSPWNLLRYGAVIYKVDLLAKILADYDAFFAANVDLKKDSAKYGDKTCYQVYYVATEAVDNAVNDYMALDLIYVKDYIYDITASEAEKDSVVNTFRKSVDNAKTHADLNGAVNLYLELAGTKAIAGITIDALNEYSIYEFAGN